jgi:hypothetical protein
LVLETSATIGDLTAADNDRKLDEKQERAAAKGRGTEGKENGLA